MTAEIALQFFFRSCGAIGVIASCFGGAFPYSARFALIFAVSLLFVGPEFIPQLLTLQNVSIDARDAVGETFTGVLLALPVCVACWTMAVLSTWCSSLLFPDARAWFPQSGEFYREMPRLKSLVMAFLLLGALGFSPYLQDVFARLAESMFVLPPRSKLTVENISWTRTMFVLSCQLAWTSAIGIALPIIAVSWFFDFSAGLLSRYLKPLTADSGLWSFRALVVGAALAASIYSVTEMVDQLSKNAVSQRGMLKTAEIIRKK